MGKKTREIQLPPLLSRDDIKRISAELGGYSAAADAIGVDVADGSKTVVMSRWAASERGLPPELEIKLARLDPRFTAVSDLVRKALMDAASSDGVPVDHLNYLAKITQVVNAILDHWGAPPEDA